MGLAYLGLRDPGDILTLPTLPWSLTTFFICSAQPQPLFDSVAIKYEYGMIDSLLIALVADKSDPVHMVGLRQRRVRKEAHGYVIGLDGVL